MDTRKHVNGICGVVVGLILGAGSMLYADGYSLPARLVSGDADLVAYEVGDITRDTRYFTRRAINERDVSERSSADIIEQAPPLRLYKPETSPVQEVQPVSSVTDECATKLGLVAELKISVLGVVPATPSYARLRTAIMQRFDSSVAECREQAVKTNRAVTTVARPTARVNNHCNIYGKDTARYAKCVVNERENQRYQGRQTTY